MVNINIAYTARMQIVPVSLKWKRGSSWKGTYWCFIPLRIEVNHSGRFNTLRPMEIGRHFADDIFKCIFVTENVWTPIEMSQKYVPKGPIINVPALVQMMAKRRQGDKPLSEPRMKSLLTHICVPRPQCVKPIEAWTLWPLFCRQYFDRVTWNIF